MIFTARESRQDQGQSLAEILVGLGVAAIIITSAVGALVLTLRSNLKSVTMRTAVSLEQELMDEVRSTAEGKWQNLYGVGTKGSSTAYYIAKTGTPPTLTVTSSTEQVVSDNITYTRFFSIENVNRDGSGNIVSSGGTEDPSTQKITVIVRWPIGPDTSEIQATEYLTRSRNEVTRFTDWSGVSGVAGPITLPENNYFSKSGIDATSTAGEIKMSP